MKSPSEAETTREIMRRTGFSEERVHHMLRQLSEAGRLHVKREQRGRIDGTWQVVPVYWVED